MKKILFPLLISVTVFSQDKLVVEYESTLEFDVSKSFIMTSTSLGSESTTNIGANKELEQKVKEAMTKPNYYTLTLTPQESDFRMVEKVENEQPTGGMMIKMAPSSGITYKNLKENIILESNSSFNQDFLITDEIKTYDWKISNESKEILGYEVRKAEAVVDSTTNLIAWYAPKLTYKNGPDVYGGLPGLIMEIEVNSDSPDRGKRKFIYKAISLEVPKDKKVIERPKKGKKISNADFDKWNQQQMDKMKEMYGGGVETE